MNRRIARITGMAVALCLGVAGLATAQEKQGKSAEPIDATAYTSSLAIGATPIITPNQAQVAALVANPGVSALSVFLEDENGQLVYAVKMNNGAVVKVDAGNGKILYTDVADSHGDSQGDSTRENGVTTGGDEESDRSD